MKKATISVLSLFLTFTFITVSAFACPGGPCKSSLTKEIKAPKCNCKAEGVKKCNCSAKKEELKISCKCSKNK